VELSDVADRHGSINATLSDAASGPGKQRQVKTELLTGPPDDARIERFMRAAKRDLRLSVVPVDRHHDMTFVPLLMLVPVKPTSLFTQPFPECRAFHRMLPRKMWDSPQDGPACREV